MNERPILFNDEMVRAILEGRKTVTRRPMKNQPGEFTHVDHDDVRGWHFWGDYIRGPGQTDVDQWHEPIKCPFGAVGDHLWVREAWAHDASSVEECRTRHESATPGLGYGPYYRATESYPESLRWRPSIHMPRWASRITLCVTGVRVERVQDIDHEGAWDEGFLMHDEGAVLTEESVDTFLHAWDAIYAAKGFGWKANPWVWVVEFERVTEIGGE